MKDRGWFSNLNKYEGIDGQGPIALKVGPLPWDITYS